MNEDYEQDEDYIPDDIKSEISGLVSHAVFMPFLFLLPLALVLILPLYVQYVILAIYIIFTLKKLYKNFEMILRNTLPVAKVKSDWGYSYLPTPHQQRYQLAVTVRDMIFETVVMFLFAFMIYSYQTVENKVFNYTFEDSNYSDDE